MASRSLGTLTLDLVAKTGGYVAGLSKAERESEKWRRKTKQQISDVSKTFAALGAGAAAGLLAVTKNTIDSAREIQNLSRVANTSAEDFQRITFASEKFGVSQEKTADILKDVSDKVGDFLQTGGGPLADFFENIAPRVGVTADQFRNLSGPDALGLYVKSLEDANVSQNEMTFFMEAIASDATLLLPLLKNNGAELSRLSDQADRFGVVLSDIDIQRLEDVRKKIDETKGIFRGLANEVAIGALPVVEEFAELLSDEQTIQAARALGQAVTTAFKFAAEAIRDTINVTRFLAEEAAAIRVGIAPDDIVRLEDEAEKIRGILEGGLLAFGEKIRFFGPDGIVAFESDEELRAELAKIEGAIDAYYNRPANKPTVPVKVETEDDQSAGGQGGGLIPPSAAATRYLEQLKQQVALLGKSSIETELYKLKLEGANAEQLNLARSLLGTVDAFERQQDASKQAREELTRVNGEALAIQASLRTEEEAIEESYQRRREIILKNTEVTGKAQAELLARLEEDRKTALENTSTNRDQRAQLEALERDVASIADAMRSEEQVIEDSYAKRRETILAYEAETGQLQTELLAQIAEDRQEQLEELEGKRRLVALQNQELLFSGIADLARQFAGEESGIFKAAFAIEKAAAVARAIVAIQTGIAQAAAQPFPANLAAIATVTSATAGIVSTIQSTNIQGQAHDGLMSVPKTGTYLLEKGERVTTERTSAKLDQTLQQVQRGGGDQPINLRINNAFSTQAIGDYMSGAEGDRIIDNFVDRNRTKFQRI